MKVTLEFNTEEDGTAAPAIAMAAMDYANAATDYRDWLVERIVEATDKAELAALELARDAFEERFGRLPQCE